MRGLQHLWSPNNTTRRTTVTKKQQKLSRRSSETVFLPRKPDDRDKKSAKIVTKVLKKHHLQPCIRKTGEITDGACILQPCIRKTGEITDGTCKIGVMCALREPSPAPKKAQP